VPPVGTYWPIIKHDGGEFSDWMLANRALDPLAARVDALFHRYTHFITNERGGLPWQKAFWPKRAAMVSRIPFLVVTIS